MEFPIYNFNDVASSELNKRLYKNSRSERLLAEALSIVYSDDEARELAEKTITLLGQDIENCGDFHEYYDPDTGAPIFNKGFQSWNFLVINMIAWLKGKNHIPVVIRAE